MLIQVVKPINAIGVTPFFAKTYMQVTLNQFGMFGMYIPR